MTIRGDSFGWNVQASRPAVCYNVAISGSSTLSPNFQTTTTPGPIGSGVRTPQNTTHIRLVATSACWVAFGAAPTAAPGNATSFYLPGNTPEYFWVVPGERLAVVQDSASGSLNVGELAN